MKNLPERVKMTFQLRVQLKYSNKELQFGSEFGNFSIKDGRISRE